MIWLVVAGVLLLAVVAWFFLKRKEGFQMPVPAGESIKISKEMCDKMLESINQYKKLKADHPDSKIEIIDETTRDMEKYYKMYGCDT